MSKSALMDELAKLTNAGPKVGQRVYAIRSANKTQVEVYGFGVYIGDKPMKEAIEVLTPLGPMQIPPGTPNPVIKLDDSNDEIWGYECHWGPEDDFDREFGSRKVIKVSIQKCRDDVVSEGKRHTDALEKARSYVQTLDPNYIGTVGNVQRYEVDGKPIYVVAAFMIVDGEGTLLNPDYMDTMIAKRKEAEKVKQAEASISDGVLFHSTKEGNA